MVLIILLVILAVMGAYGVYYKKDTLFLILGLIHLFFAIDYLKSYTHAYTTITFSSVSMTLSKKRSSASFAYDNILSLSECRNGFLEIAQKEGEPVFVHSEIPAGAKTDHPQRTINILKKEIELRSHQEIPVTFRNR